MMPFYAHLNEDDIVVGMNELWEPRNDDNLIELKALDNSVLFKKYNRETGEFEEYEFPTIEPEPTQLDRIEQTIQQNYAEAQQEGADAVTLELIERGVI